MLNKLSLRPYNNDSLDNLYKKKIGTKYSLKKNTERVAARFGSAKRQD